MSPASECKDCHSTTRPLPWPGPRCATCHRAQTKKRRLQKRAVAVKNLYGLSMEEYEALKVFQKGKCAVCGNPLSKSREPDIDHDHRCCPGPKSCGKCVRGLTHGKCNRFLAWIEDNTGSAEQLLTYLQDPPMKRMREGR